MEVYTLANNEIFESAIDRDKGIVIGRLKKGADLLEGILAVCEHYGIKTASFYCIGSLFTLGYYQFDQNPDGTLYYSDPIIRDEPGELIAGNGFIGLDADNNLDVHYHGTYLDKTGKVSGGHFIPGKNEVAVTIEFTIHYTEQIDLQRKPDEYYQIPIFHFNQREA